MFGLKDLKPTINVTKDAVECPVRNCVKIVERQKKRFKRLDVFKCRDHGIYISPSTFEYEEALDNILWTKRTDRSLLERILGAKRESRIARDNSEDAVTWNVFRLLEKEKIVSGFLSTLISDPVEDPELIYWSYSQSELDTWALLQSAKEEFETRPEKGSEPDLIIKSKGSLFFIEAKLTATNNTVLHSEDLNVERKYETGGGKWFDEVVDSDFRTLAVASKKYELLRFWVLGSWIANRLGIGFHLINLVPAGKETDIEDVFKKHVNESLDRTFLRAEWEDIYRFLLNDKPETPDTRRLIRYLENKTIGYKNGELQEAFSTRAK